MPEKKVRTVVHNGRRRSTGEAYSPKHNSRSGGIGESLASDSRIRRNVPIHAIEEPSVPCGDLESITKLCRMDPDSIAERIREEIGKALKYRIEIE